MLTFKVSLFLRWLFEVFFSFLKGLPEWNIRVMTMGPIKNTNNIRIIKETGIIVLFYHK